MRTILAHRGRRPTERYVSTTGSDANSGLYGSPWRTIRHAASIAFPGMTIWVAPGTYPETVAMGRSGTASARIRFVSSVLWGARLWPTQNLNSHIFRVTGSYVDVEGFDMRPAGSNVVVFGVDTTGTNNRFAHNRIHDINVAGSNVGSAMGVGGTDSAVEANWVYKAGHTQLDHCIYAYSGAGHLIVNNVVGNTTGWGVTLWGTATRVRVFNNTVFNCGRTQFPNGGGILIGAGEYPDSDARDCVVANNIVYGNPMDGIMEGGIVHDNRYVNNLTYGNRRNWRLINGVQSGTIIRDPQFVRYEADGTGDYHLQASSPAVGAADADYAPAVDFEGRRRDLKPDLGALEY